MPKLTITGKDLVAVATIAACSTLIGLGHNHLITYLLIGVASAYGLVVASHLPGGK